MKILLPIDTKEVCTLSQGKKCVFVNKTTLLSHVQIHSQNFIEHNSKAMFYEFVSALTLVINLKRDFIFIQNILANPEDSASAYLLVLIFR